MPDWDAKWSRGEAPLYGDLPNEWARMAMARSDMAPASALMLADGDGRNGTWMARQGLAVTAVERSRVADARARARDAAAGVAVERICADLTEWRPPAARRWDAVVLLYLHCGPEERAAAVARPFAAAAPGGWILVEGFAKSQAARPEMGPSDPALLYDLDELVALLPDDAEVIEAFSGEARLAEGPGHQGLGAVSRLLARRADG